MILQPIGNKKTEDLKVIPLLQANKLLLDDCWMMITVEKCKQLENKINVKNAITFFSLSQLFNISCLSELPLSFIERCFPIVADSNSFLKLDFISVAKILLSSELFVDTELQVFNAAEEWLNHNEERRKYTKSILSKIRLSLLSVPALNYISNEKSCFTMNDECLDTIKVVLENKKNFHSNKLSKTRRYCNQTKFNIIVCGGIRNTKYVHNPKKVSNDACSIESNCIDNVIILKQMKKDRRGSKAVCVKGEVYVFGGFDSNAEPTKFVEKYSIAANAWEEIAEMYVGLESFCACSFMDNVYIVGGCIAFTTNLCIKFDTTNRSWKEVARMNEPRRNASCTVFEGRVVISGGLNVNGRLNTVESYDHLADTWSHMPNMVIGRYEHNSVAIKNKLFVVGCPGQTSCEVYDSTSNTFVMLTRPPISQGHLTINLMDPADAIAVGSKIFSFGNSTNFITYYDVENNTWSSGSIKNSPEIIRVVRGNCYFCTKVPQLF